MGELSWLFSFILVWSFAVVREATWMEDHLETEINPREPRSFKANQHDTLDVRLNGFNVMFGYHADGHVDVRPVPNWELFAMRYWFETRTVNSSCPMEPSGISAHADWALMVPCLFADINKPPRVIFVHNHMLPHFVESTLYFMDPSYRFVLVSGGTDMTVPRQIDQRYRQAFRGFGGNDGGKFFHTIVNNPRVIHWFAENRDVFHPKLSTLPTGMSTGGNPDERADFLPVEQRIPILQRNMTVLLSDRIRSGTGQWALRAEVKALCGQVPKGVCTEPPSIGGEGISHKDFHALLNTVPFIASVKGGGLDPSPKAWEAILAGTIPIIDPTWLSDAYMRLPVVLFGGNGVSWQTVFNSSRSADESQRIFRRWAEALAPYYVEGSRERHMVLQRLRTHYWLELIHKKVKAYDATHEMNLNGTSATFTAVGPRRRLRGSSNHKNRVSRKRSLQGPPPTQHIVEQHASTANTSREKDLHHSHGNSSSSSSNSHHTNTSNTHHTPGASPSASVLLHDRIAIIVVSTDGDFVFSHTHPLGEAYESSSVEEVQEEEVDEEVDEGVQEEKRKAERKEEKREEKEEKRREEKKEEKRQKKEAGEEGASSSSSSKDNAALYQQFHSPHSSNNNINNHHTAPPQTPSSRPR